MSVKEAVFVLSAPELKFCPESSLPEVCFSGRSNVGKSSLINALVVRKNLAKTSNVPGKTRAMNYFLIDQKWHLVDLPGYGYAKVPRKEQERWGKALNEYLLNRKQLKLVVLLIDIRHDALQSDLDFIYWLGSHQIPFAIVLSKADKISSAKRQKAKATILKDLKEMNIDVPVFIISSEKYEGSNEFLDFLTSYIQI
jgi:GTP-binding protein